MWAFLDPNDNSKVVLVMSTQGFIVSSEHFGMAIFDHNIRYRFEIENTGDAKPDAFVDVTYSPGLGRLTGQTATITLPNGKTFTAPTTIATQDYTPQPPVVTTDSATGVSFFAGAMDDPFFLDDTGANRSSPRRSPIPGIPTRRYWERAADAIPMRDSTRCQFRNPIKLLFWDKSSRKIVVVLRRSTWGCRKSEKRSGSLLVQTGRVMKF